MPVFPGCHAALMAAHFLLLRGGRWLRHVVSKASANERDSNPHTL